MRDDSGELILNEVTQCPKCKAFHSDDKTGRWVAEVCETFDPEHPCKICGQPVFALSFGGPDICPPCDAGVKRGNE